VTADAGDLIETVPDTHTDVDRALLDKLPLASSSSSLSAAITATAPGVTADSDGMFHGLGDHASNQFSLDGEPITDQQSKVFSNQIPLDAVQSMEVIEGAPPAEYGDKTSLVISVTTRSGIGVKPPHGDVTVSYGTFGTSNESANLATGNDKVGNFISVSGLDTGRFLDGPEFATIHDHGNEENLFDRFDYKPSQADSLSLDSNLTRSWFQTPNSYDAQNANAWSGPDCPLFGYSTRCNGLGPNGQLVGSTDQRSQIRTFNLAPTWTRVLNPKAVFTFAGFSRQDQYHYYPSDNPYADLVPDLNLQTVGQHRTLTDLGVRSNIAYASGIHDVKVGVSYSDTILTERDELGILPLFNGYYRYYGHANIRELALFAEDTITKGHFTFKVGARFDYYDGITTANQFEPRLGAAYNFKPTNTVLRVSYARTLETPFNENLVIASEGCNNPVIAEIMAATVSPCVSNTPLSPGWRNEFHAGLEQAFGKFFVLDGEYIWKYTHKAYDFSTLGDTPLTFPIEWSSSKIPGFAIRGSMPAYHGLSAYIVMSHVSARFFEPQVSGIGATPFCPPAAGCQVFRVDHDEVLNQTTHLQYQPWKTGPWISVNWRYDSGEVAGAVPCAGGDCANGPAGSSSTVDVSGISPDQQYQAGLFCGTVYATPTTPISPTGLCPASMYASKLLTIPAPGTENNDHNPPRIGSRNLVDLALGDDNLFHGDRYKWSARIAVVNVGNVEALYNYLSTFSGTHYVSPRTVTATVGFHF
jgi:hypothetical protein